MRRGLNPLLRTVLQNGIHPTMEPESQDLTEDIHVISFRYQLRKAHHERYTFKIDQH